MIAREASPDRDAGKAGRYTIRRCQSAKLSLPQVKRLGGRRQAPHAIWDRGRTGSMSFTGKSLMGKTGLATLIAFAAVAGAEAKASVPAKTHMPDGDWRAVDRDLAQ